VPLLAVTANDIDTAGHPVDEDLPVAWLEHELADAEAHAIGPGHVSARLSRSGKDVVVRGRVKAEVEVPCARCLEPTRTSIDADLSLLLQPAPQAKPAHGHGHAARGSSADAAAKGRPAGKDAEYEFSASEAEIDTYDGETVVLDGFVREALLLELPNFPLCSESCAGIRPRAGAPGGITSAETKKPLDPRLQALSELKAKLFEPEGAGETPAPRRAAGAAKPAAKRRARSTPLKANLTKTKKKSTKKE
jgi:uncharacterized protein